MTAKNYVYPAIVEDAGRNYSVYFPDLPGCVSAGDTLAETALNAEEALSLHLEGMLNDGDTIPEPSDLDRLEPTDEEGEVARLLVRADVGTKIVRLNISLEATVVSQADRKAAALGMTRSGFIASLIRHSSRRPAKAKPAKRRRTG
jgi:predicted RNase H-like HicB family nuclease